MRRSVEEHSGDSSSSGGRTGSATEAADHPQRRSSLRRRITAPSRLIHVLDADHCPNISVHTPVNSGPITITLGVQSLTMYASSVAVSRQFSGVKIAPILARP